MAEDEAKNKRLRICVLKEITKTEQDYVDTLQFLVDVSTNILTFIKDLSFFDLRKRSNYRTTISNLAVFLS